MITAKGQCRDVAGEDFGNVLFDDRGRFIRPAEIEQAVAVVDDSKPVERIGLSKVELRVVERPADDAAGDAAGEAEA